MSEEEKVEVLEYFRGGKMYRATANGVELPEWVEAYNNSRAVSEQSESSALVK